MPSKSTPSRFTNFAKPLAFQSTHVPAVINIRGCIVGPAQEVWGNSVTDDFTWAPGPVWYDRATDTVVSGWSNGASSDTGLNFFDAATMTLQTHLVLGNNASATTTGSPEYISHDGGSGQIVASLLKQNGVGQVIADIANVIDIASRTILSTTSFVNGHVGDWRLVTTTESRSVASASPLPTLRLIAYSITGIETLHFGLMSKTGNTVSSTVTAAWSDGIAGYNDPVGAQYNQSLQTLVVAVSEYDIGTDEYDAKRVDLVTGGVTTSLPPPQSGTRGFTNFNNQAPSELILQDDGSPWVIDYDLSSANGYSRNDSKLWRWNGASWTQPTEADFTSSGFGNYDPTLYVIHDPVTDAVAAIRLMAAGPSPTIWIYNARRCISGVPVAPFQVSFSNFPTPGGSGTYEEVHFDFFDGVITAVVRHEDTTHKVGLLRLMLPASIGRQPKLWINRGY